MRGSTKKQLEKIYRLLYGHFGKRHWWPADSPFEVMVGAILTQNTAWTNVEKAIANLKLADALTPGKLHKMPVPSIARLIRPSGFYNQKSKRLKYMVNYLMKAYGGDTNVMARNGLPDLRIELLSLSGIGKETADSILLYACNKPVFVVDSYTHRIFRRHGLIGEDDGYDDIQKMFMDNLEQDPALFNEYHALIVELGKNFCRIRPLCGPCPLSDLPRHL